MYRGVGLDSLSVWGSKLAWIFYTRSRLTLRFFVWASIGLCFCGGGWNWVDISVGDWTLHGLNVGGQNWLCCMCVPSTPSFFSLRNQIDIFLFAIGYVYGSTGDGRIWVRFDGLIRIWMMACLNIEISLQYNFRVAIEIYCIAVLGLE